MPPLERLTFKAAYRESDAKLLHYCLTCLQCAKAGLEHLLERPLLSLLRPRAFLQCGRMEQWDPQAKPWCDRLLADRRYLPGIFIVFSLSPVTVPWVCVTSVLFLTIIFPVSPVTVACFWFVLHCPSALPALLTHTCAHAHTVQHSSTSMLNHHCR